MGGKVLWGKIPDVLAVKPGELGRVKDGGAFAHPVHIKHFAQLRQGKAFPLVPGVPAQ